MSCGTGTRSARSSYCNCHCHRFPAIIPMFPEPHHQKRTLPIPLAVLHTRIRENEVGQKMFERKIRSPAEARIPTTLLLCIVRLSTYPSYPPTPRYPNIRYVLTPTEQSRYCDLHLQAPRGPRYRFGPLSGHRPEQQLHPARYPNCST